MRSEISQLSKETRRKVRRANHNSQFKKRLRLRLRLRQRVRYKTIGFYEQTNGLHVPYNIWYISLPYSAKQQREMTKFKFCGVRGTHDGEFLFLCLNVNAIPTNYVPRQFKHILRVSRLGIIATQFSSREVILSRDLLAAVVVVAS